MAPQINDGMWKVIVKRPGANYTAYAFAWNDNGTQRECFATSSSVSSPFPIADDSDWTKLSPASPPTDQASFLTWVCNEESTWNGLKYRSYTLSYSDGTHSCS